MGDWLKDKLPKLAMAVGDAATGGLASRIGKAVGIDVEDEEGLQKALEADPTALAELKARQDELAIQELRLQNEHALKMAETRADDRADARRLHAETRTWVNPTLSILTVLGFFGALALFAFADLPQGGTEVLLIMVGALAQHAGQIYSFHFGSSEGSKAKDRIQALTTKTP